MSNVKEQIEAFSTKVEDIVDRIGQPLKPYIPAISRFLIIATFIEDSLRIIAQWKDQLLFMQEVRSFPRGLSHLFLGLNVLVMLSASSLIMAKKHQAYAVYGLMGVIICQAFGYGLLFDASFFLRNLSVLGGLVMVLSETMVKRKQMFAALPQLSETDRRMYLQLAGRVLLIFLFLGSAFHGRWSFIRAAGSFLGLTACVMVAVGFKARWSAMFLVLFLSVLNIFINNFWSVKHSQFMRDFLRYDFFQSLSALGGFLLLISIGPGGLSYDEKKKEF
ncbi:hypothetical protein G6F64_008931 [Rhizopus arrhizus]|uniref:SURF4-domain-containing protein n=1 Tax=Rhizopus oryzae TaxID=64495 RepID=A0A9P6X3S6_RHIOR|nr:hypothetical protein G6F64_008931 [Rhizopus arrhizus]